MGTPVKKYFWLILVWLAVSACDQDASHLLPRYTGAPGELLVIMPDPLFESRPGDLIYEYFGAYQPMLPQGEPRFDIVQMSPEQINHITRQHRNLLFVNIASNSTGTPRVEAKRNKWASEQLVAELYASSIDEFDSLMRENGGALVEKFNEFERRRLQSNFEFRKHHDISTRLQSEHRLNITVPSDCDLAVNQSDFVWIKRQRERNVSGTMHDILQGVLIYHYPYTEDSAFSPARLLAVRDSVLRQYVPGSVEGSYMSTEYLIPPEAKTLTYRDEFAIELRGLWKVRNGAPMGGPFVSLTFLDKELGRVVTAEGFVFAPKFPKREYLREIEAMIFTIRPGEPSEQ